MPKKLVIIGAGFAGMYAALSAARLREASGVSTDELEIALISPEPALVIRPRLYESNPEILSAPLNRLLKAVDVAYVRGRVETIDTDHRSLEFVGTGGKRGTRKYDRLVVATGSRLFRPRIPGPDRHGFSVDRIDEAIRLDHHLQGLAARPASIARDTVVVAGGGLTGIEIAAEIPTRLFRVLGWNANIRVIIVERRKAIAPSIGAEPRPIIEKALRDGGVEIRVGASITALEENGVALSNGEHIESETLIWATGMQAAPLTGQIPGVRDDLGRLLVDRDLRVLGVPGVFAAGDAAKAACDDKGHYALMSCQHATRLGAFAGNNAAAELIGLPTRPYHQEAYVTCVDLGSAGAVFTRGWNRQVNMIGPRAKAAKKEINTVWIYPPPADRATALAAADPEHVTKV